MNEIDFSDWGGDAAPDEQPEQATKAPESNAEAVTKPTVIDALLDRLRCAEAFLGFNPEDVEQGTDDWFMMRLGVASASRANMLLAGANTKTRQRLINELCAEICTGVPLEEMSLKAMEWGKEHEAAARQALSFAIGEDIHQIAFVYREQDGVIHRGFGCSPDGIAADGYGVELKCPYITTNHVDFILNKNIKSEYIAQVQFSLWVTGLKGWYFGSFDPRMKRKMLDYVVVKPDPVMHRKFDEAAPRFIADLKAAVAACGEEWPWDSVGGVQPADDVGIQPLVMADDDIVDMF